MAKKAAKTGPAPKKANTATRKKAISKNTKKTTIIRRQNTMETTSKEGADILARLDKLIQKKKEEKKKHLARLASQLSVKNAKAKAKKITPTPVVQQLKKLVPGGFAATAVTPKPATRSPKSTAPSKVAIVKKAISKTKIKPIPASAIKKTAVVAGKKKAATPVAVASASPFPISSSSFWGSGSIQKDIDSCKSIASTEVVDRGKLGKQIIKRSLKGQTPAATGDSVKQKKKGVLRTKTGERLAAGMIDVVFCCDTTSSMGSQLSQCLSTVKTIIKKIIDKTSSEGISVKFGFVAYRDHPPQDSTYLTCSYDLTSQEEILEFIGSLSAYGGGDFPEAAFDGLYVAAKHMTWRDSTHIPSLRYIFHIADAPPHGKEYSDYKTTCPCELDINKISHIINMKQIHYRFVGTGSSTDKMVGVFKDKIVDFEECKIDKAADMDIRISDMIIRELLPDMVEEE